MRDGGRHLRLRGQSLLIVLLLGALLLATCSTPQEAANTKASSVIPTVTFTLEALPTATSVSWPTVASTAAEDAVSEAISLPEEISQDHWYEPVPRGLEIKIGEKLKYLQGLDQSSRWRRYRRKP